MVLSKQKKGRGLVRISGGMSGIITLFCKMHDIANDLTAIGLDGITFL